MKRSLQFLPEAEAEMWEAAAFYESRREGLGVAFVEAIERTFHEILDAPNVGAPCRNDPRFRQRLARRFPYRIMYQVMTERIEIAAVMHTSRHPDSWIGRTRS